MATSAIRAVSASPPIPSLSSPRIVVSGAGIVTALGNGWSVNATALASGRSAFVPVTLFDASRYRAQRAAQCEPLPGLPPGRLGARRVARMDRGGRLLLLAAREAVASAHLNPAMAGDRWPVVMATTSAGMNLGQAFLRQTLSSRSNRGQLTRLDGYFANRHLEDLAVDLGLNGPGVLLSNACASGANAIGHAWEWLKSGRADVAVAGGYDALSELVFAGFDALQALSTTVCRPFDRDRDGLGLGEGAAVVVLETLDHARQRGAQILGELAGYGCATDLHHLTQPHPEGRAALASMRAACASAGVVPAEVDYLNAHGTGTPLNDAAEARAIADWAGEAVETLAVSSTKFAIGHLLGAAGAVEAVTCLMALREQWLPPTLSVRELDPACRFRLVREPTRAARLEVALSNSFGFGGSNATLVLRRWHG